MLQEQLSKMSNFSAKTYSSASSWFIATVLGSRLKIQEPALAATFSLLLVSSTCNVSFLQLTFAVCLHSSATPGLEF